MDPRLNQAALEGDIDALYLLIHEDPYLLDRFDQIPFVDTPLHIVATTEHPDFAMEMINLKLTFARKLNPDGFSPLHLALQNEQTEMAFWLLDSDESLARVKGREGMTPLHYIARRGDLYLLSEFLQACPESIKDVNIRGETALHIAVNNGMFQALEVLVGWLQRATFENSKHWEKEILNWRDKAGNTVLHIAAANNQPQVVRLLLKLDVKINLKNLEGKTAVDILESQTQVDNKNNREMLSRAGGLRSSSLPTVITLVKHLRSKVSWIDSKAIGIIRRSNGISSDTRNALLIVAVLISTVCYQAALSPPGGIWQGEGGYGYQQGHVGTAVMDSHSFIKFLTLNTLFLSGALLLIAFLLSHDPSCGPLLTILFYFSSCYAISMSIIYPQDDSPYKDDKFLEAVISLGVLGVASASNVIISGVTRWLVLKPRPRWKRSTQTLNENKVWWEGSDLVSSLKGFLFSLLFVVSVIILLSSTS